MSDELTDAEHDQIMLTLLPLMWMQGQVELATHTDDLESVVCPGCEEKTVFNEVLVARITCRCGVVVYDNDEAIPYRGAK